MSPITFWQLPFRVWLIGAVERGGSIGVSSVPSTWKEALGGEEAFLFYRWHSVTVQILHLNHSSMIAMGRKTVSFQPLSWNWNWCISSLISELVCRACRFTSLFFSLLKLDWTGCCFENKFRNGFELWCYWQCPLFTAAHLWKVCCKCYFTTRIMA